MKKLYTYLLAAAVAATAVPAFAAESALQSKSSATRTVKTIDVPAFPAVTNAAPVNKSVRSLRKADALRSIEGIWTIYLGDFYDLQDGRIPAQAIVPTAFNATLEGTTLTFEPINPDGDARMFKARYDEEALTLTIEKAYVFNELGYYIFQQPIKYGDMTGIVNISEVIGTFDPANGSLSFPENQGISWEGYQNMTGEGNPKGSLIIFDIVAGYQFDPKAALEGNWEPIGNVIFHDGWLVPAMGPNYQNQNDYDVRFEQNTDIPTRFRLVNPYKTGPVAPWNGYEGDGYIVFDIADHQHVMFFPTDAGFYNTAILPGGISTFYCYNALGYEAVNNPSLSIDELIALFDYIPFTKYTDNKVILSSVTENGQIAYDANFGTQSSPLGGNFWEKVSMETIITFPTWFDAEVGRIAVDENAEVEYFNLNGLRLSNPAKGEIVIKRTGSKVTKEIIK